MNEMQTAMGGGSVSIFFAEPSRYAAEKEANKTDKHPSLQHACDCDAAN